MRRLDSMGVGLGLSLAACSLHSLDYLSEGQASPSTSAGTTSSPAGEAGQRTSGGSASGGGGGATMTGNDGGGAGSLASIGGMTPVPDCQDGLATVDETDVDCGGRTCSPCQDGSRCLTGTDCQSAICTNQVCQPPSCTDLALNGTETDLNCGGTCPPCALGHGCGVDDDCDHAKCVEGMCRPLSCTEDAQAADCPILVDKTPYQLAPSHAATRCLDDNALSVADGNAMLLWSCRVELQQTFWAVALADGYFALQSALSGKCLQVRGASLEEGAVVEQFACGDGAAQRWKPSRLDSGFVRLVNAASGLAMGVAGPSYDEDKRPIVQGAIDGTADTSWAITKRETGAFVQLAVHADRSVHATHQDALVTLTTQDDETTHWRVMPGLADPHAISFQSRDNPGRYLRHSNFRLWSDTNDGSPGFSEDATFKYGAPFVGTHVFTRSLEALNRPGAYLTRREDDVRLAPFTDDASYQEAATWWILGR